MTITKDKPSTASGALSERDRALLAVVIQRFVARSILRREIADTYDPLVCTVSAFELIELADELVSCCDGDNVQMAEEAAALVDGIRSDLADNDNGGPSPSQAPEPDDILAHDIVAHVEHGTLDKFDAVSRIDYERWCAAYGD